MIIFRDTDIQVLSPLGVRGSIVFAVFALMLACLNKSTFGQNSELIFKNLSIWDGPQRFQHLDIRDGLSQSTVYDSYQDSEGFMWFGTRDGLNRYDGYNFKVFGKARSDSNGLQQGTIRAVTGDRGKNLWLGTDGGGLYRYSKQENIFRHVAADNKTVADFGTANILSLEFDSKGDLWIGTRHKGLLKYDSNNQLVKVAGLYGQIWTLACDSLSGAVWAGTDNGLIRIDADGNIQSYLSGTRVESIKIDNQEIWIGTYKNGLYRLTKKSGEIKPSANLPDNVSILCLLRKNEKLWIGSAANGLYILDLNNGDIINYTSDKTPAANLLDKSIRSLYKDQSGIVWVGSNNRGIFTWSEYRSKFALYQRDENQNNTLSSNVVLSFTQDMKDRLWIGTDGGGINVLDREKGRYNHYSSDKSSRFAINNDHIITMLTDKNGDIWWGADGGGLSRLNMDSGEITEFLNVKSDPQSLPNNSVLSLMEDKKGNIWVGTYKGLGRLNPQTGNFQNFYSQVDDSTTLSGERILSLLEGSGGYIWIGTYTGGLNRLNPETNTIKRFEVDAKDGISAKRVQSLYEDRNGNIWIGTYNGLHLYDRKRDEFIVFDEQDGFKNDVIYGILPDEEGNLWLSTNGGVSRFNISTFKIRNYSIHDGLQSNEFNGGAYFKNDKGELFFGGVNGFNIIDPDNIPTNRLKPPVAITSFQVAGEDRLAQVKNSSILQLGYDENFFSIEFAALDFVVVESNRYRYKLEGLDEDWNETGNRNIARYTNVPPGEYLFKVQASNSGRVWNRSGIELSVKVLPPFWQTWWFRTGSAILFLAFLYGLYRYRVNALMKVQRTKQQIAGDLHDEVSATLSSITYFAQAMRQMKNGEETERFVRLISESASEAKEKITDIIWSIDPDNDDWVNLLSKCRRFASDLLESKNMDYELDIDTDINQPLDLLLRQHLWLIFKEMVVNAARHSKAQKVEISLGMQGDILRLVVQDNGIGMEGELAKTSGHGIKNIQKRAKEIGAELQLETDPEIGTRWMMSLKM